MVCFVRAYHLFLSSYRLYGLHAAYIKVLYGYFLSAYGVRSRRTHLLEDQLGRADAGSWQIADRYYMAS